MRLHTVFFSIAAAAAISASCTSREGREYRLEGQILSIAADRKEATIKHEEIKGLMSAMTMQYHVRDPKDFEGLAPGDLINSTLVIVSNDGYLKDVKKVGSAPLEKPSSETSPARSGAAVLRDGEPVPNAQFVDQDGRARDLDSFRGSAVLLTFMYTSCPMPDFCPRMDRNFAAIQQQLKQKDQELNVQLVSVSFDPTTDTPPVLKRHATELGADPRMWTFLTGETDAVDQFAGRFGVSIGRDPKDQTNISHNLRTAIIDRQGNLVKVFTGNEWTPSQAIADIKVLVGVD